MNFFSKNTPIELQKSDIYKKNNLEIPKKIKYMYMNSLAYEKRPYINSIYSRPKMCKTFLSSNSYLWLLKPNGFNRGRGIQLFSTLGQLEKLINEYYDGMDEKIFDHQVDKKETNIKNIETKEKNIEVENEKEEDNEIEKETEIEKDKENIILDEELEKEKNKIGLEIVENKNKILKNETKQNVIKLHTFVIQKYIEKPLLINSRKFDIRVWALVTQNYDIYFFK